MKKKPPAQARVVAMRGEYRHDLVSQADLADLANLQRIEWAAAKRASLKSEEIKMRLRHGATIENGPLDYDPHLEMARTRQKEEFGS